MIPANEALKKLQQAILQFIDDTGMFDSENRLKIIKKFLKNNLGGNTSPPIGGRGRREKYRAIDTPTSCLVRAERSEARDKELAIFFLQTITDCFTLQEDFSLRLPAATPSASSIKSPATPLTSQAAPALVNDECLKKKQPASKKTHLEKQVVHVCIEATVLFDKWCMFVRKHRKTTTLGKRSLYYANKMLKGGIAFKEIDDAISLYAFLRRDPKSFLYKKSPFTEVSLYDFLHGTNRFGLAWAADKGIDVSDHSSWFIECSNPVAALNRWTKPEVLKYPPDNDLATALCAACMYVMPNKRPLTLPEKTNLNISAAAIRHHIDSVKNQLTQKPSNIQLARIAVEMIGSEITDIPGFMKSKYYTQKLFPRVFSEKWGVRTTEETDLDYLDVVKRNQQINAQKINRK